MTLKEFDDYLYSKDFPYKNESLIVFVAIRYDDEDDYDFSTELLKFYHGGLLPSWYWEDDLSEQFSDVEILGYVPVSQVHRFIPLNCEHKLHMVGEDHLINEFLESRDA